MTRPGYYLTWHLRRCGILLRSVSYSHSGKMFALGMGLQCEVLVEYRAFHLLEEEEYCYVQVIPAANHIMIQDKLVVL